MTEIEERDLPHLPQVLLRLGPGESDEALDLPPPPRKLQRLAQLAGEPLQVVRMIWVPPKPASVFLRQLRLLS